MFVSLRMRCPLDALAPFCAQAAITFTGDTFVDPDNVASIGITGVGSAAVVPPPSDSFAAFFIGSGGTGSVSVTGAGAVLDLSNTVNVGATSSGTLLIQGGGVVYSRGGASPFPACPNCNGTYIGNAGGSSGVLTVTGAGSQFNVGDALGTNFAFGVANGFVSPGFGTPGAPTSATLNVLAGASANTIGTFIGGAALSSGVVNVSGPNSTWTVMRNATGLPSFIAAGNEGSGTVNITGGGTVNSTYMTLGRSPGSSGVLKVEGASSLLKMVGGDATDGGAGMTLGWEAGASGSVSVLDGGRILVDARGAGAPGGFRIGGADSAGTGTMTISGAGSLVEIIGDGLTSGIPSGFTVGLAGTGQLSILDGGRLTVDDSSSAGYGAFSVGGNGSQDFGGPPAGTGTLVVSGAGSELAILSSHGTFVVGHATDGTGTLTVGAQGKVSAQSGYVGLRPDSVGVVDISGAGTTMTLAGKDAAGIGSFLAVGLSGTGTLNISNAGLLSIQPASGATGGLTAGGIISQGAGEPAGIGIVNVSNAGRIEIVGDTSIDMGLGSHPGGSGTLNVTSGGKVSISRPVAPAPGDTSGLYVGLAPGAQGAALISGAGSSLDAGVFIGVGVALDKVGNGGSGVLTVRDGGIAMGDLVRIGAGGRLNGNGLVIGNLINAGGVIAPGNSPGTLTIQGSLTSNGKIEIEVFGLAAGEFDVLAVMGNADFTGSTVDFIFGNGFLPKQGDSFVFLSGQTNTGALDGASYIYHGAAPGFEFSVDPDTGRFLARNNAAPVPEPAIALYAIAGLVLLGWRARRRLRVSRL